jgi:chromate transporter
MACPDVHHLLVRTHCWMTDQEFANLVAVAQSISGPDMILMMSFVGWKVWGFPGAVASAVTTFGPPCTMYSTAFRPWDRFRDAPWQRIVRLGFDPAVMGLVIAGGTVMARTADGSWRAAAATLAAAAVMLTPKNLRRTTSSHQAHRDPVAHVHHDSDQRSDIDAHAQKNHPAAHKAELANTYRDTHPEMHAILALMDLSKRWPLADRNPLRQWAKSHVTLLGDSAHATLQSHAQSAGMAIEDTVCLATLIDIAGGDIVSAFSISNVIASSGRHGFNSNLARCGISIMRKMRSSAMCGAIDIRSARRKTTTAVCRGIGSRSKKCHRRCPSRASGA